MYYKLNEAKEPVKCDLMEWSNMFENDDRRVAFDAIEGKEVSTVFLGLDHNYFGGKPLLFETMVFDEGESSEHYCLRYSTYEQALKGHQEAIEWVKESIIDECEHASLEETDMRKCFKCGELYR